MVRCLVLVGALVLLAGCAQLPGPVSEGTPTVLSGRVHGGVQPISGASIMLYAAGSSGLGSAATNLLQTAAMTDSNGDFAITGDYTCPSATTQVYLVSSGGNPGLSPGGTNPAAVLISPIGDCGSLSSSTFLSVNEVTTAASAWALSQFLGAGAQVGSTPTNATGLRNAFALAQSLVNLSTGSSPGPNLPAAAHLEAGKLYALANVLAACVNSDGGAACTPLFAAATANGNVPANVLDAALAIVRNPGSNVAAVFNAAPAQAPYLPALSNAPNDWTLSVTYTGGGLSSPTTLALDSTGSCWVANYSGGSATKLSPTGVAQRFSDPALNESYGLTIDSTDSAWITNEESAYATNYGKGSLTRFSSAGQLLSGAGITGGGVYFPYALAADSNSTLWVADYGNSHASLLELSGASLAGSSGYFPSNLPLPIAVTIDGSHNAWFAAQGSAVRVSPAGVSTAFACCGAAPDAIAIDSAGNVWLTDSLSSSLTQLSASGATLQHLTGVGGLTSPGSLALDGSGAIWVANLHGASVSAFSASPTGSASMALSPSGGFGLDAQMSEPFSVAVDASGNLWVSSFAGNSVVQLLGLATPLRTPRLGPPVQP